MFPLLLTVLSADVHLEGAPAEAPAELVERLSPYLGVRSAHVADLSADGTRMLVSTRFGEASQLHVVEGAGAARTQVTFGDEPISSGTWTRDGELLYRSDQGGNEHRQIFSATRGQLSDSAGRWGGVLFSPDGSRFASTSNVRNGTDTDVVVMDVASLELMPMTAEEGYWSPVDWSPDGEELLVARYISVNESELWLFSEGELTKVTPRAGAWRDAAFSADGDHLYVLADNGAEHVGLWTMTLRTRRPKLTAVTDVDWNVENLRLSHDRSVLAYTVNQHGYGVLHLMDTASGDVRIPDLPEGVIPSGLRFARDAPVLAMTLGGPTRVPDAWTLNLETDELTRWTFSELGGLDPEGFIAPTVVTIESFDDVEVPFFYYRPEGEGPFPVLMGIHGGPEAQARPHFKGTFQYFLSRGIAVVVPNVRGSNGYGRTYLTLDDGFKREDSVRDIGAILDWVDARPELDADRVGVRGGSYGGYMVLASLIHYPDRFVAGCDSVGIANFVSFLENTKPYRRDLRRAEYGDERDPAMRAHLEAISPVARAAEIEAALFVVHGANDPRVPVGEAEQIAAAVREAGGSPWVMIADDEGHGFRKKGNRDLYTQLMVLFFEEHLLGGE
jgi:dipeptidyl aminopeptidase/acylaminoacyl peptidase